MSAVPHHATIAVTGAAYVSGEVRSFLTVPLNPALKDADNVPLGAVTMSEPSLLPMFALNSITTPSVASVSFMTPANTLILSVVEKLMGGVTRKSSTPSNSLYQSAPE